MNSSSYKLASTPSAGMQTKQHATWSPYVSLLAFSLFFTPFFTLSLSLSPFFSLSLLYDDDNDNDNNNNDGVQIR